MIPKGKLIPIGGAEDKGTDSEEGYSRQNNLYIQELQVLGRIRDEINHENPIIEVITTASGIPVEVGENYLKAFSKLPQNRIDVMHIRDRNDVKDPAYIKRIEQAHAVLFSGGNQQRITQTFGGSSILNILHKRYQQEDFLIAGTSAGAMAMSGTMIYKGSASEALIKGEIGITSGLGFLPNIIVDSHFVKRGRFGRLATAVASNPSQLGLGLGVDTGVLITEGHKFETIGSGLVIIFDGTDIKYNNIADVEEHTPISIENMRVHILAKGMMYDSNSRQFIGVPIVPEPAE
jgi:cyanophycinase